MQHLPPTEQVEALVVQSKLDWDKLRAEPTGSSELRFQAVPLRDYNRWSGLLPYAYRRDTIQATRPAGCWCLGYGGWNPHYESSGRVVSQAPFCGCAEGQAASELARSLRAESEALRRAAILETSEIPSLQRHYTFMTFPDSPPALATRVRVEEWVAGDGAARGKSLMLWGDASVGKTGLAIAALKARMATTLYRGLFLEVAPWMEAVRAANDPDAAGSALELARRAELVSLLVLDDLGKEWETDYSRKVLFRVLAGRHRERRVTIFTSNESPPAITAKYGAWFMDRITEMCGGGYWVLHMDGVKLRELAGAREA